MRDKMREIMLENKYWIGFNWPSECSAGIWRHHNTSFSQSIPRCDCCEPTGRKLFYRRWGFTFEVEFPIRGSIT